MREVSKEGEKSRKNEEQGSEEVQKMGQRKIWYYGSAVEIEIQGENIDNKVNTQGDN